jgi:hypothetical protein
MIFVAFPSIKIVPLISSQNAHPFCHKYNKLKEVYSKSKLPAEKIVDFD